MNTFYLMLLATVLFVLSQTLSAHPVGIGHEYAGDPRDEAQQASYDDCVGDYKAAWEGRECDWVRYMHPAYKQEKADRNSSEERLHPH